ncbi:hypothetical protein HK405_001706, partial [Cladochytrium tenue]
MENFLANVQLQAPADHVSGAASSSGSSAGAGGRDFLLTVGGGAPAASPAISPGTSQRAAKGGRGALPALHDDCVAMALSSDSSSDAGSPPATSPPRVVSPPTARRSSMVRNPTAGRRHTFTADGDASSSSAAAAAAALALAAVPLEELARSSASHSFTMPRSMTNAALEIAPAPYASLRRSSDGPNSASRSHIPAATTAQTETLRRSTQTRIEIERIGIERASDR